ncbi:MAG TPA: hypothetical protein VHX15_01720 [Frankiaceae bacterium]|jgi:hypothetical protein|nr:hypothetical protein [Frankiaceae bacterium]
MTISGGISMSLKRALAVLVGLLVALSAMAAGTEAAFAGDRPTDVAFVKANPIVQLKHNGSTIVKTQVRCVPGWQASDLTVHVSQPSGAYADGLVITTHAVCNNKWYTVWILLPKGFGTLKRGNANISSQFLVNNVQSGDSAAGHGSTAGWIKPT